MHAASCVEQGVDCVPGQVSNKFVCVLIVILILLLVVEPQRSIRGTHLLLSRAGVRANSWSPFVCEPFTVRCEPLVTPRSCFHQRQDPDLISFTLDLHVRTPGAKTSSGCIEGNYISSLLRVGDRTTANVYLISIITIASV